MRKYYQIDAKEKILGRLATEIARVLSGKGKVNYTPNIDQGDFVVVTNSDHVMVTGRKKDGKVYYRHSGYPGGIKGVTFKEQMEKDSRKIIESAVYGMLPKNKLRRQMMKRLFVYKDDSHEYKDKVENKS